MISSDVRTRVVPAGLELTCGACGLVRPISAEDLDWRPLAFLLSAAKHECRPPSTAPATPRPESPRVARVRSFVADYLVPDPTSAIALQELHDVFDGLPVGDPHLDRERFSQALRRVLPDGTAIRREMINGVRANRVIGMRWR